ncbi:MAG: hypothetical protein U0T78_03420 [Cloacibacterium normanense]
MMDTLKLNFTMKIISQKLIKIHEKYLEFFKIVGEKTADMIVEWIR